jgi:hypothetical protein
MPTIDPTLEKTIREKIKERAQKDAVLGADFPVHLSRFVVSSDADLIEKISVAVILPPLEPEGDNEIERQLKYLLVELIAIDDVEGEDNCPGLALTYRLRLFVGFRETKEIFVGYENSTDDFNASLIKLRNEFTLNERLVDDAQNITSEPLSRENFILLDDDPISGATGHFIDLNTIIEVF